MVNFTNSNVRHFWSPTVLRASKERWTSLLRAADSGLRNVFVYLDDLTVTGATKEEHDENLQKLIDAAKVGLKFKKGSVNFVIRI